MQYEKLQKIISRELDSRDRRRVANSKFQNMISNLKQSEIRLERLWQTEEKEKNEVPDKQDYEIYDEDFDYYISNKKKIERLSFL